MNFDPTELTAAQLRAARQLIGWHATDLANASGVGIATIRRAELCDGVTDMKPETATKIVSALQKKGLMFYGKDRSGGAGVRLKR
jgi:transcriptional regulator with XRE-family HTH domain